MKHEADLFHVVQSGYSLDDSAERYIGSILHRVTEGTGGDRGKGDRLYVVLVGKLQCIAVTPRQELIFRLIHAIDRPQAVDYITVGQIVSAGDNRFTRFDRSSGRHSSASAGPAAR